jgi:tetratricopeptide (TPR) repeat protein
MRRPEQTLVAACLLLVFAAGCHDPRKTDLDTFNKANTVYKQGDYKAAIKLYEEIVVSGYVSPAVYYNLGNAYMKSGQLGRSLVTYERALRLQPRDSDLKANVTFARNRIQTPEPEAVKKSIFPHLKEVTMDEIVLILTVLIVGISVLFLAGLFLQWRFRKTAFLMSILAAVFVFHLFALFAKIEDLRDRAIILSTADVKYEPEETATTHFSASEGWKVRVLKESSGWVKIERPDGLAGWVPKEKVERI